MTEQAKIRLSASVILFRVPEGESRTFEIFLLKRHSKSRFMPGRFVFPGGGLETSDGLGEPGLRHCAIRELWEEAGVALVRGDIPDGPKGREILETGREMLERTGLNEVLGELGLEPALDLMVPYARWVTPVARPKRFDTIFYLAVLPKGQKASPDLKETSEGVWLTPAQALEENKSGQMGLAPPQVRILGELSAYSSLEELFDQAGTRGDLEPVMPVLWSDQGQRVIFLPWDKDHRIGKPQSSSKPCPAESCTRLVHDEGRWHPYACRTGVEKKS